MNEGLHTWGLNQTLKSDFIIDRIIEIPHECKCCPLKPQLPSLLSSTDKGHHHQAMEVLLSLSRPLHLEDLLNVKLSVYLSSKS